MERPDHENFMSDIEQRQALAMLLSAGYTREQAKWMSASCPSIQRCKEVCGEKRSKKNEPVDYSDEWCF